MPCARVLQRIFMKNGFLLLLVSLLLVSCGSEQNKTPLQALSNDGDLDKHIYYGDIENNEVIHIDTENMRLVSVQKSSGDTPYEITNGYDDTLFVINRKGTQVDVLEDDILTESINLDFSPRSIILNSEQKLALVSSTTAPAESLLKTGSLLYSDSSYKKPVSFGGSYATGHPIWVNDSYFLLLDRTESAIELYKVGDTKVISKLKTSSAVHHLVKKNGIFYGTLEGIQGSTSPGILKFKISYEKFIQVQEQLIADFDNLPKDFKSETWGFHHLAIHPDGKHIYTGSYEGNIFVLDAKTLALVDTFKAGRGAGHFLFYRDTLIVTNHHDTFKSFYDVSKPYHNTLIKNLSLAKKRTKNKIMQSHTSHIVDGYLYFTMNSDQGSIFYKISLDDYTVVDSLNLGKRYCVMGTLKSRIHLVFSSM